MENDRKKEETGPLKTPPAYGPQPDKAVLDTGNIMDSIGNFLNMLVGILQGPVDTLRSFFPKGSWLADIFGTPEDMNRNALDLELMKLAEHGPPEGTYYSFSGARLVPKEGDAQSRLDPSGLNPTTGEPHSDASDPFKYHFNPETIKNTAPDMNDAFASAAGKSAEPDPYRPDFNPKPAAGFDIKVA